jgi:hypothetical protein
LRVKVIHSDLLRNRGPVSSGERVPPGIRTSGTARKRRLESRLSLLSLLDLLDDRAFARLNYIGSVVAFDIAILAQRRRFPIDLIGDGSDLHGIRQALPDPDRCGGGGAAGGVPFYP